MARARRKKQEVRKANKVFLTLLLIAVLLSAAVYGSFSSENSISNAIGGIFGIIKYFIPIGFFAVAIYVAYKKDSRYYSGKVSMMLLFLTFVDILCACSQISNNTINTSNSMSSILSRAYDLGSKNIGGGVYGTFFATLLVRITGVVGAIIISVGILFILFVLIFNLHPEDLITNSIDRMEENKERREQEKKSRVQEIEPKESWRDRRLREKEEKAKNREKLDEQITINLNDTDKKEDAKTVQNVPKFLIHENKAKAKNMSNEDVSFSHKDDENKKDNDELFSKEEVEKEEKTKEVLQLQHARTEAEMNYEFPPIELLQSIDQKDDGNSRRALLATAERLRKTLYSFGVSAKVENVSVGPAITRYELAPAEGVRVSKIANLADDIALSLEAESIRIEAPIPGKHTVGIEVPNKVKSMVPLRDIIDSKEFKDSKSKLAFALGTDVAGNTVITDIAKMPHLLIAGATGSGKSVCINTMVTSIIYKAKPSEVKLLMIDPKVVELSVYNGIPHLLIPVVTDPKKAAGALSWAVQEMVDRYSKFADKKVRDIKGYNELAEKEGEQKLPQIVIIIDELADLMMVAAKEVEDAICRLAQMARAAGMHLVIATQRPSVDVITGIIKANIPSRIAFAVSSQVDSRTILDGSGAEKLLGKGDMLFYPSGAPKPTRLQGAFVSDKEVENIVKFIKKDDDDLYDESIIEKIEHSDEPEQVKDEDSDDTVDPLLDEAIDVVVNTQQASTSFIQRKFKVGYARAGRIIDQMEERGIVSGYQGSKPRTVLMPKERWEELKMAPSDTKDNNNDNNS